MEEKEGIKTNEYLRGIVLNLPEGPGIYQYLNSEGTIIYVGKAKNLKRRVSSYFNKDQHSAKTRILVSKIADIRYIVVNTEEDALLLENNLIKKYKPRYNVLLKDDKSYPSICVSNEYFPRVFKTRNIVRNGSTYYGPYSHVPSMHAVLDLIKKLYPLRTCRLALTPENIREGKFNVCLEYHIKNCRGCCVGAVSHEEYADYIASVKQILAGDTQPISDYLMTEMMRLAENMEFEKAQELKVKYDLIEKYRAKSVIVSTMISNVDVFSFESDDDMAFINYMHIRSGAVVRSITYDFKRRLDETPEQLLSYAIGQVKAEFGDVAKEVIVPFLPDFESQNISFIIPQRGDKKKLLEVSLRNAKQRKFDRLKAMEKLNPEQRTTRLLTQIQKDLHLPELPRHIECFDNSNTQGTNPVASCVVFKNAKPSKKDYRHFNIKTVEGPDDFASMIEVLTRRYTRLLNEGEPLPQLVIVDGGKGQLSSAVQAFDDMGIRGKVALIGIAKRLEEIYFPGDSLPIYISKTSETLKVIQHLRNEAHRFGITHHRNRRSKSQVLSELDGIKGIGQKTADALIRHFHSLKRAKEASEEDIAAVVGKAKAKILIEAFGNAKI